LGAQQQTIEQNKQMFPLNNLSTLSGVLRGYNVPTSTTTTADMSPLSALAGVGAGAVGLFTPGTGGKTPFDSLQAAYDKFTGNSSPSTLPSGVYNSNSNTGTSGSPDITGGTDYSNTGSGSPSITSFPASGATPGGADDDPSLHPNQHWDAYNNAWVND
jgi:hypothetical protein